MSLIDFINLLPFTVAVNADTSLLESLKIAPDAPGVMEGDQKPYVQTRYKKSKQTSRVGQAH